VDEATHFLDKHGSNARLIAGGTELLPRMKYGLALPDMLISLKGLQPHAPSLAPDGSLILDVLMTIAGLIGSPEVRKKAPLLTEAASTVASNEIRNMGTLGGNLCQETRCLYYNQGHKFQFVEPCFKRGGDVCYFIPKGDRCWAVFMSDMAPALICLGAEVKITGLEDQRHVSLGGLYTGNPEHPVALAPCEILRDVLIPSPPPNRGTAYRKLRLRGGLEYAALSIAALLEMEDDGITCSRARIVVGAISPAPSRASKTESVLVGKKISDSQFSKAAQMVTEEIRVIPHHGYSAAYLKKCLRAQTHRALASAAERIK
jgi:4-hydroxybenzoyl-CoA reductase beta subunit